MENIHEKIKACFGNLGIIIDSDENFLIADYVADSVTYITLLTELEAQFDIEIPDEYLVQGRLMTYQDLYNMVSGLTG
jgi:acyl carrier protein